MDTPAVSVAGLRFGYGERQVLNGVDLRVDAGEIFGVAGADGAGKSTLLRLLIGQLAAASGHIRILGMDVMHPSLRESIAYMPQTFGQYADLSARENLQFYAALHGRKAREAEALIADLIARAGLRGFEGRRAGQLSGGMMQKLALACALVSRPRAMFLDEATTGVDPVSRRAFWQLLEAVRSEGVAIVYATANMEEAERCDRVASLRDGRLTGRGRPQDLIAAVGAQLCLLTGPDVRAAVPKLLQQTAVDFAFPVGRQVRLWLKPGQALSTLDAWLAREAPGLHAMPATPGLHDVSLRELALAERERGRA